LDEDFLGEVFSLLTIVDHSKNQAEDSRLESAHKFVESSFIASLQALN
jgi:hypothetical protein